MVLRASVRVSVGGYERIIPSPVATFGCLVPGKVSGALVHVVPPTAFPAVENNIALRGKIAIVRRGECSFAAKAKSLQAAGAIAMILTNSNEELVRMGEAFENEGLGVEIPVLMVGFALGKSLKNNMMATIELKEDEKIVASKTLLQASMEAVKKTTNEVVQASVEAVKKGVEMTTADVGLPEAAISMMTMEKIVKPKPEKVSTAPLFAFVLYATTGDSYSVVFAPLADFGLSRKKLYFRSRLAFSRPFQANSSLLNNAAIPGSIVMVERGGCTFPEKIERVQKAGAIAVIVGNNDHQQPESAFVMTVDKLSADHITIPSVMLPYRISQEMQANPPDSVGIVCLEGAAAGILLAANTSSYSLWKSPPHTQPSDASSLLPPLLLAARQGSVAQLVELLQITSPHECDAYNVTALHHACIAGCAEAVELLLAAGARVDSLDLGSQTPLHYACMTASVPCVQALLTAAAHTFALNEGGCSPLHVACFAGSTECMELLLTASATLDKDGKFHFHGVDDLDKSGRTPLHIACLHGHTDCALYLMAASAKVNIFDINGATPLHYMIDKLDAKAECTNELHVIQQLLEYGASMVEQDRGGKTRLLFDRIVDRRIRREVEILYLRQQVRDQQSRAKDLQDRLEKSQRESELKLALVHEQARELTATCNAKLEAQALKTDQLQRQLTSVLQFLQASSLGNAGIDASQMPVSKEMTETDLAQEAALARDLGKRCLRNKQYGASITYFERSLELYRLPGVSRLLDYAHELETKNAKNLQLPSSDDLLVKYNTRLASLGAPAHVLDAIKAEIDSMAMMMPGSSEFAMIQQWLDWLLTLPWTDQSCFGLSLFKQVQEEETYERRQYAAKVIQRAVREHLSAFWMQRELSAIRIQALWRGFSHRKLQIPHSSETISDCDSIAEETPSEEIVDIRFQVDPSLRKPSARVLRGVHLTQGAKLYILQSISNNEANQIQHYVWSRWGYSGKFESALKGPYDSEEDVLYEFDRLYKLKTGVKWGTPNCELNGWNEYPYFDQHNISDLTL
ncbi:hypothetical protein THRCLA_01151 [Thraustotheca clavata]|uniref:PA domain-containing protein n=1 Tax=Thraustotheca clavata TaxID=74557 RepID=A0A1W0A972_9STRA|nr:hypothetical protein THRCLA_01151 [Thraustotheca clavata]